MDIKYIKAKGLRIENDETGARPVNQPKPLFDVLNELVSQVKNDPQSPKEFYILLELEDTPRKSIIRADFSAEPYQLWYCNLRYPVPFSIRQEERLLLEEFEEFGPCIDLKPLQEKEMKMLFDATLSGEQLTPPEDLEKWATLKLAEQKRPQVSKSKTWASFSLFAPKPTEPKTSEPVSEVTHENSQKRH